MTAIRKRSIYNRKRRKRNIQTWFRQCKESFNEGFKVVTGFSYSGKLKTSMMWPSQNILLYNGTM